MGKQNRKKQRHQRKNKQNSVVAGNSGEGGNDGNSSNSIVKRLRHVDRQVRLATLLGLQSTLLVSKNAFNNNVNKNNMDILQAIREQIMDHSTKNLECAIAASECIVQYLKNKNWDS